MNRELTEPTDQYRIISEMMSDYAYCFRYTPDGRAERVWETGAFAAITGYTPQELTEQGWDRLPHPDDAPILHARIQAIQTAQPASFEFRIITKDGQTRWVRDSIRPVLDADSEGAYLVYGAARDITAEKTAESELREQSEKLAGIIAEAADAIITIDAQGRIESFNPAAERIFGYTSAEVIGINVHILMPQPYQAQHDDYLQNYLRTGIKRIIGIGREVVGRRKDGSTFPIELAVTEVQTRSGVRFTGILRDISLRRHLEKLVLEIVAEEQRKVGQDLHDVVGQDLLGLSLLSEQLAGSLSDCSQEGAELAESISMRIRQALDHVRRLSRGLVPVEVDADGLMAALEGLVRETNKLGTLKCVFTCPGPIPIADNTIATQLFRVAQEAVTNSLKHAHARHLEIRLHREPELDGLVTRLDIRDDGIGIDPIQDGSDGMGLQLMKYRAGLIGAHFDVSRGVSGGTVVTCLIPKEADHGE